MPTTKHRIDFTESMQDVDGTIYSQVIVAEDEYKPTAEGAIITRPSCKKFVPWLHILQVDTYSSEDETVGA